LEDSTTAKQRQRSREEEGRAAVFCFLFSEAQHYMMKRLYRPEELGRDHDIPETVVLSVVHPSNYRRVSETHLPWLS
jgi:hypothetical protein